MVIAKKQIVKEDILNKISDYDIFRYYLGNFKLNGAMCSPFGKDCNPSFVVKVGKMGKIVYKDMRFPTEYSGDCWKLVMQLYGLTFIEAINKIANDFGITNGSNNYQLIQQQYVQPEKIPKAEKVFKIVDRVFTKRDIEYWNQYLISEDDCKKENIFSIKSAWIDDCKLEIEKDELAFAYYFSSEDKWKYYFPERKGKGKWWTNLNNSVTEGNNNLINCDKGIITKSRKDRIVLTKLGLNVCNTQNESSSSFTEDFKSFLSTNVKEVYLSFDNDRTGVANSIAISRENGYKYINVPRYLGKQGITDWADWVAIDGSEPVLSFLKKKKLI